VFTALTESPTTSKYNRVPSGRPFVVALRKGPVRGWDRRAAESIGVDLPCDLPCDQQRNHPAQRSSHVLSRGVKQEHRGGGLSEMFVVRFDKVMPSASMRPDSIVLLP
jgi:hypothetical protein